MSEPAAVRVPTPTLSGSPTRYRLEHIPTGRLLATRYEFWAEAEIAIQCAAPRSFSDYRVVPSTGADLSARLPQPARLAGDPPMSCDGSGIVGIRAACCMSPDPSRPDECCNNPVPENIPCDGCEACVGIPEHPEIEPDVEGGPF
jgi:hypothetical protein